jgi:hypothetical protein
MVGTCALGVCVLSFITGRDIPAEAGNLLQTLVTVCIGAYTASSAIEHCYDREKEKDENGSSIDDNNDSDGA